MGGMGMGGMGMGGMGMGGMGMGGMGMGGMGMGGMGMGGMGMGGVCGSGGRGSSGFGGGLGGGGLGGGGLGGGGLGGGGLGGGGLGGGGFGLGSGAGNLVATNNITTVMTLQALPSYCWRWGSNALGQLTYGRQEVLVAPEGLSGTSADMVMGSIQSGPRFDRFRWAFYTNQRYLHREGMPNVRFANYFFRMQMRLFQRMSAFGIVGYEDNMFQRSIGNRRTSGTLWTVGLSYQPSRRTHLQGGIGQRFFGTTAFARATYGTKRNRFGAAYSQQFFTYDQLLFAQSGLESQGPVISLPSVTGEAFLSTNTTLYWSHLLTEKTRFMIRGFQIQREFQESDQKEQLRGGSAFWAWRFAQRTNIFLGGMLMHRSFPASLSSSSLSSLGSSSSNNLWNASLSVSHSFDPKLNLIFRYVYGQGDRGSSKQTGSTDSNGDFSLNMITAMVLMRF
jgi:hypothetical protein